MRLVGELEASVKADEASLIRAPLSWPAGVWQFRCPGAYLGYDGGAGLGSGPGMVVGAALALRDSGRLPVAILGDGDTLMANTALWTAAHHQIPMLLVVANNRTYLNDEHHQERVARARPVENRWIGQRMDEPPVDFAGLRCGLGARGFGPVEDQLDLAAIFQEAVAVVRAGQPVLVDVVIGRD